MAELDPQAEALLETVETMGLPPTYALSPESARERLAELFASEGEPVDRVEDFSIPGPDEPVPVRLYAPAGDGHPLLMFYHGGGWVIGDIETYDAVCRALSNAADCAVLSVDYRLAPEHPFPAAVEDAYAALEWAAEYAERINCDPRRVAVGGDSAEGNLAAAVSLMSRDQKGPEIAHQLLVYPAVASPAVHAFPSYEENSQGYLLEAASIEWFLERYLPDPVDHRNAYAAPLLARDYSDLPSATVLTAGFDPLRDEGREYADRLESAGVEVTRHEYEGMIHGFVNLLDHLNAAGEAIETLGEDLQRAFR
ncbi:alpha/beta hydrolase [Halalkalicoccus sp. NIPERK01]|uniref:alpha/beta hydrolase n=1 Tax=Halalkalicoccus sp. NIPERK01 TaxID=3053469 RepID=UPI00256EFDF9|nr:alpha/beta hydrolase [Halalkalicoccus sp. NIPERK01]MDL5360735.1 alpha/beta hydrolase [Halalkalicoccus sp. NIPERK01]